jgi:hypothetical protein
MLGGASADPKPVCHLLDGTHNFCGIVLSWSAVGHQLHAIAEHIAHIACAARVHYDANPIYHGAKVGSLRVQQHQIGTAAQFDPVDIRQAQGCSAARRRPMQHRRGVQHEVAPSTDARHHSAWRLHEVLVKQFIASFKTTPAELVLDFDATDNPLYGRQGSRFFHGY